MVPPGKDRGIPASCRSRLCRRTARLLAWGEIALAGADGEIFLQRADLDAAIAAIGVELSGLIRNDVLAAQFILNSCERPRNVFVLERSEGTAAGGVRQLLQNTVAALSGITMPLAAFVIVYSEQIVLLLLGARWSEAAGILRILALAAFVRPAVSAIGFVMISCGKTARFALLGLSPFSHS